MSKPSPEARIDALIQQCQDAHELLDRVAQNGGETDAVEATISDLFREIGQAVFLQHHPAHPSDAPQAVDTEADAVTLIEPPPDPEPSLDSLATEIISMDARLPDDITDLPEPAGEPEERAEGWYTEEVPQPGQLFNPGDLQPHSMDEIPEADAASELTVDLEDHPTRWTLLKAMMEANRDGEPLGTLAAAEETNWIQSLHGFVDKATASESGGTEEAVTRLLWACTQLPSMASGLPASIQTTLVAWLGTRIRHLATSLADDRRLQLASDNLTAFHRESGLLDVASLLDAGVPERQSWSEDQSAWRNLLQPEEGRR